MRYQLLDGVDVGVPKSGCFRRCRGVGQAGQVLVSMNRSRVTGLDIATFLTAGYPLLCGVV
jgi:hypothetical protein